MHQTTTLDGTTISILLPNGESEAHEFDTAMEADARWRFITEGLSWIGTPFRDCADIKGRDGAIDCAMLLTRSAVDTGLLTPFDPRPYPPRWHLHNERERFLEWIEDKLGAHEVDQPQIGDVVVWRFGRCFSHGAILINSAEVVHAYYAAGFCLVSRLDEPLLSSMPLAPKLKRPTKFYDLWSAR